MSQFSAPTSATGRTSRSQWIPSLLVLLTALIARLLYVHFFAVGMPFWDQWDAEGDLLLKPWLNGSYHWLELLAAHNEHRILPTKLMTLGSYIFTGQWNNIYEARASAVVYALIPAILVWHGMRIGSEWYAKAVLITVALCAAVLPYAWENFLVGFQSQFYFLILFGLAATALAATMHENIIAISAVLALSILSALTMASGMLTPAVAAGTYVIAASVLPGRRWPSLIASMILLAIAAFSYLKMPIIAEHHMRHAQSLTEFLNAAGHVFSWPVRGLRWPALVLWAPGAVGAAWILYRRRATTVDITMIGWLAWTATQGLAIAYGRGHDLDNLSPRYTELLIPGLFANTWFAISLLKLKGSSIIARRTLRVAAFIFGVVLFGGWAERSRIDWEAMRGRYEANKAQSANVLRYVVRGDEDALNVGDFQLPYPNAPRLKLLLNDPYLLQALSGSQGPRNPGTFSPAKSP